MFNLISLLKRSLDSRMFTCLFFWYHLWILGTLSMLAIGLAGSGHLHSANNLGTDSHCMFKYTRDNNGHALKYPVLEMYWAVPIPLNFLLGIG